MRLDSIARNLPHRDAGTLKNYRVGIAEAGYELGFGRRGCYAGHAHLHFVDILLSFEGIRCRDAAGALHRGMCMVIPARTWYGEIEIGNFFFLKFCATEEVPTIPDKTTERLSEGQVTTYSGAVDTSLPWWPTPGGSAKRVGISLKSDRLVVEFGGESAFAVIA